MTKEEFATIMKQFRERRKLTQEEAAADLGVSVRTLQNWEIARNMPNGYGLQAILRTLEAPAESRRPRLRPEKKTEAAEPVHVTGSLETHLL
ncbi:MAG: helix-turn-helix transcriptional regulator [Verrucomicrobiota bacterium]